MSGGAGFVGAYGIGWAAFTNGASKHPRGGFVLEGWPRLSEQKEFLAKFLTERNLIIDKVFYLGHAGPVAVERIKGRVKKALAVGSTGELMIERK